MKKVLLLMTALCIVGCDSTKHMETYRDSLSMEIEKNESQLAKLKGSESAIQDRLMLAIQKEHHSDSLVMMANAIKTDKVRYVFKLHVQAEHSNFNLEDDAKDVLNAYDFEIPVDKSFFESCHEGDKLVQNNRQGSLLLHGSFGNDVITVKEKRIIIILK